MTSFTMYFEGMTQFLSQLQISRQFVSKMYHKIKLNFDSILFWQRQVIVQNKSSSTVFHQGAHLTWIIYSPLKSDPITFQE